MPNVEIAALCDVDQSVINSGVKTIEAAGKKRPATYADFRRLLDDKTIDAVSIATPNFHHTLQTIWAVQAGKDVLVEKPVSYNMFEAQQIVAATRKYNRIVQNGTGAQLWLHEAKKKIGDGIIGDVYMARGLVFKWRDTIGRAKEEPVPPGVSYDLWTGPAPVKPFSQESLPLQLALAVGLRQRRHRQPGRPSDPFGAHGTRREVPDQDQLDGRALHVRRRSGDAEHAAGDVRVRGRREEEAARLRSAPLDLEQRGRHRRALGADGRRDR